MRLDKWLEKNSITQTSLARAVGVYPNQIHNILKGKYMPKADLAKKIRSYTKNEVTLDELYDIPSIQEQKNRKILDEQIQSVPDEILEGLCEKFFEKLIKVLEKKIELPKKVSVPQEKDSLPDDLLFEEQFKKNNFL